KDGLAALRGALLSQRVQPRAERQSRRSGSHAQGDPRPGESPSCADQGITDRCAAEGNEAADCRRAGGAEGRRDDDLLCLSINPLATNPDQQSTGKNHSRDPKTNSSGRGIPAFPDGHSALMLAAARLRHIASTKWGKRRYMLMDLLLNPA